MRRQIKQIRYKTFTFADRTYTINCFQLYRFMDRNDITRISELPDNGIGGRPAGQPNNQTRGRQDFGQMPTQYTPLNVHQNQFGIPPPSDTQLPTISVRGDNQASMRGDNQMSQQSGYGDSRSMNDSAFGGGSMRESAFGGGSGGFSGEARQPSLPPMLNRGIPQDMESYQNDEYMIPNHIPTAKLTNDYLREYETKLEKMSDDHQKQKHRQDLVISTYDEFQTPILIGVLFFLFQLPIINTMIFKHLGFLKIYNEDGNMNLYGLMFKSFIFGMVYFGFIRITTFI